MSRPERFLAAAGFAGSVHIVNPAYADEPGVFARVLDVPAPIDLAMVMVRAELVQQAIIDSAAVGARAAIVCSGGFAELGPSGLAAQQELTVVARDLGVRLLGPNSQGVVRRSSRLAAAFTSAYSPQDGDGPAAYIGQSGALGGAVMSQAREAGLVLSWWASTGNQCDVDVVELAEAAVCDPSVRTAMLYLESIPDCQRWQRLVVVAAEHGTRLTVLRTGYSEAASRATASHTGALAGDAQAFDVVCEQAGVVLTRDIDAFVAAGASIGARPQAHIQARPTRLAIVTTSGGGGSIAADCAADLGLVVPPISDADHCALAARVPSFVTAANPLDLTGQFFVDPDADLVAGFAGLVDAVDADAAVLILTNFERSVVERVLPALHRLLTEARVPLALAWLSGHDDARELLRSELTGKVAIFDAIGRAVSSMRFALRQPGGWPVESHRTVAADAVLDAGVTVNVDGAPFLRSLGIGYPAGVVLGEARDAVGAIGATSGPFALKLHSASIVHKTELGGVRLSVPAAAVAEQAAELFAVGAAAGVDDVRVIVEPMVPAGVELIVGCTASDQGYPAIIVVGFGGTLAELIGDVALLAVPVDEAQVSAALRGLRLWPLLDGFRGAPKSDVSALVAAVAALSQAVFEHPRVITELDINPLVVHADGEGVTALDFYAAVQQ
jgi:acyl-CoA synthetase (NDP forming)